MHTVILAAGATTAANTDAFWSSPIGVAIKALMVGVGIIVVILAVLKAIKDVTAGKPGNAAKIVLAAGILAAILFNPSLISSVISLMGDLFGKVVDSISSITGGSAGGSTTP